MPTTLAPHTTVAPHHHGGGGSPHNENSGYCSETNGWFIATAALGVSMWLLCAVVQRHVDAKPVPGKVNWSRPWYVAHVMLSILVWSCVPQALAFFIFHTVIRGSSFFEEAARFSCMLVYGSPPYFGLFIGVQGGLIVVATRPKPYCEALGRLLWPQGHLRRVVAGMSSAQKAAYLAPVTLMYGSTSRGNVYLEVARRAFNEFEQDSELRKEISPPRVLLADVGRVRSWVAVNADAMEMPPGVTEVIDVGPLHLPQDDEVCRAQAPLWRHFPARQNEAVNAAEVDYLVGSEPLTSVVRYDGPHPLERLLPLQLALPGSYCDEVLLTPWLRKMPPLGSLVTDGATVRRHVQSGLRELLRVLRPGGRVLVVDGLEDCLTTEADLVAAGFVVVAPTEYAGARAGSLMCMQTPMFCCVAERARGEAEAVAQQLERDDTAGVVALAGTISAALRAEPPNRFAEGTTLVNADQTLLAPMSPLRRDQQELLQREDTAGYSGASGTGFVVLLTCQTIVFFLLLFVAAFLAKPLNVPKSVVIDVRVGGLLIDVACNYPMMAYFSRAASTAAAPTASLAALLFSILKTELLATGASLLLSGLVYIPQLALQYALSAVSVSYQVRTFIAIIVSIIIGVLTYKRGEAASHASTLRDIGCSEERFKTLEATPNEDMDARAARETSHPMPGDDDSAAVEPSPSVATSSSSAGTEEPAAAPATAASEETAANEPVADASAQGDDGTDAPPPPPTTSHGDGDAAAAAAPQTQTRNRATDRPRPGPEPSATQEAETSGPAAAVDDDDDDETLRKDAPE